MGAENISESGKRHRALIRVQHAMVEATKSIEQFLAPLSYDEVIRKVHTDVTNIVDRDGQPVLNDDGSQQKLRYYSLWISFGDFRLLDNGHLARNDQLPNYQKTIENDGDDSYIVSLFNLSRDYQYSFVKLTEIALQLEKFQRRITPDESR